MERVREYGLRLMEVPYLREMMYSAVQIVRKANRQRTTKLRYEMDKEYFVRWRVEHTDQRLATMYRISLDELRRIKDSPCGICGVEHGGKDGRSLIDHDHRCHNCGFFNDHRKSQVAECQKCGHHLVVRGPLCTRHNNITGYLERCSSEEIESVLRWINQSSPEISPHENIASSGRTTEGSAGELTIDGYLAPDRESQSLPSGSKTGQDSNPTQPSISGDSP